MNTVNVEQSAIWNGADGEHWTRNADAYDASTARQWEWVIDVGAIGASSHVLDIGCGTGKSSRALGTIARAGSVLGVDLSGVMLELARTRTAASGLANVDYAQGDAQVFPFEVEAHDVAVSFYGGMFFSDPVAAYQNIAKGLAPGSALVLVGWRELARNEWFASFRSALALDRTLPTPPPHAPSPFFFADADHTRGVLDAAGFSDVEFTTVDVPMTFGATLDAAWQFVRSLGIVAGLTADLEEIDRQRALDALRDDVTAHDTGHGVVYDSSSWLITARRG